MNPPPRILFLADAGPEVGGGHVMRCLTLARALIERGADCAFVESINATPILRNFGWPAQTVLAMTDAPDLAALVAYAATFAEQIEADVVVVDHYGAGLAEEEALRVNGRRIVVVDDLANRQHASDLLIDPGYARRRDDYDGLTPPDCAVLVGPAHALVRPEFAGARRRALSRRAQHAEVRRGLIALGLTDVGGVTARVVKALINVLDDVRLDIVLTRNAPSLPILEEMARADRRLRLCIDTSEMASLMADADIAIGAGGSSTWERAAVGLPTATVILADNQRQMVERMAHAGLTVAVDAADPEFETQIRLCWNALVGDSDLRWRLAERSAELCDGNGVERVADAILRLRRA
ncbi:MAG TPA: UDP-2,4-diacetamido-2,4,6-trideoxy-beta-L-altropyranose hydrolase [Caulobacteraceae bacterium]